MFTWVLFLNCVVCVIILFGSYSSLHKMSENVRSVPEDRRKPTSWPEEPLAEQDVFPDQPTSQESSDPEKSTALSKKSNANSSAKEKNSESVPEDRREPTSSPEESLEEQDVLRAQEASSDPDKSTALSEKSNARRADSESGKPDSLGFKGQTEAGARSCLESSKLPSSFVQQSDFPLEGAVGGENLELKNSPSSIRERNKNNFELDRSSLHSGKIDVFKRYFNQENMEFFTLPENRRSHRAERHRHFSEGRIPETVGRTSEENPLCHMQTLDSPEEPLLNQAGAIVGVKSRSVSLPRSRDNNPLSEFGYAADVEHSIGSDETAPIADIYSGIFSPSTSSRDSSRGVSSGSFVPSFPSRPPTGSDYCNPKISPLPVREFPAAAKRRSPVSTDSDTLPVKETYTRRRRPACSRRVDVPPRCESELAGSEGSYSDEKKKETSHKTSTCSFNLSSLARRKDSKDSSTDSTEHDSSLSKETDLDEYLTQKTMTDSEDESVLYPELSHSVESDHSLPIPDISENIFEIEQSLDDIGISDDAQPKMEEAVGERDPFAVLSCKPGTSKSLEQQLPKEDV